MTYLVEEVYDPRDGTLLAIAVANMTTLVEVAMECRRRELQLYQWRKACEAQMHRRLVEANQKLFIVRHADGRETEIARTSGRTRQWDADDLRATVMDLIEDGILVPSQVADLTRTEVKVDGTVAAHLLERVPGEARDRLEACFEWVQRGRPSVRLSDVPQLVAPEEAA